MWRKTEHFAKTEHHLQQQPRSLSLSLPLHLRLFIQFEYLLFASAIHSVNAKIRSTIDASASYCAAFFFSTCAHCEHTNANQMNSATGEKTAKCVEWKHSCFLLNRILVSIFGIGKFRFAAIWSLIVGQWVTDTLRRLSLLMTPKAYTNPKILQTMDTKFQHLVAEKIASGRLNLHNAQTLWMHRTMGNALTKESVTFLLILSKCVSQIDRWVNRRLV